MTLSGSRLRYKRSKAHNFESELLSRVRLETKLEQEFDLPMKRTLDISYKVARRIAIFVIGVTVMLVGIIMIVTPGPAFIVVPLGLAILAVEFAWARRWLKKLRAAISSYTSNNRADKADAHRIRASDRS
jgi:uncharacterized protein (TIGR02611 family)